MRACSGQFPGEAGAFGPLAVATVPRRSTGDGGCVAHLPCD